MASTMRLGYSTPDAGGSILARNHERERESLAAFQTHVDDDYSRSLSTLIESEIIPRLVVAHAADSRATHQRPAAIRGNDDFIAPGEVESLAPLALQVEADTLLLHIEAILARGVSVDTVMVDLLAPTARLLGEYWNDDRCDFIDVTMGLWRLQEVVHEIGCRAPVDRPVAIGGHRVLFSSMPGDQHSFGAVVIDEVFRRDGWVTERLCDEESANLMKRVASDWFDMVGLTLSCDCHIGDLTSTIAALRNVSRNSRVCVMVGGSMFSANPGLATEVGADGTARDAKLALAVAAGLVRDREREAAAGS